MKDFYIFLDIDGVLNNYDWIKKFSDDSLPPSALKDKDKYLDPRCIKVLNDFMTTLKSKGFNPTIVISSAWRIDLQGTIWRLLKNGLNKPHSFSKTGNDKDRHRGKEIYEHVTSLFLNENEFVIIDDEVFNIKEYFKDKNIIKTTGIFEFGLTQENVDNFLNGFFKKEKSKEK